jgi:hypothetical protein
VLSSSLDSWEGLWACLVSCVRVQSRSLEEPKIFVGDLRGAASEVVILPPSRSLIESPFDSTPPSAKTGCVSVLLRSTSSAERLLSPPPQLRDKDAASESIGVAGRERESGWVAAVLIFGIFEGALYDPSAFARMCGAAGDRYRCHCLLCRSRCWIP